MHRISSNATLFLKIFIPVFWTVFFGAFTLAVLLSNVKQFPLFDFFYFKMGLLAFFLGGAALMYFTIIQLKRVELGPQHLYASNYFKTYRYPFDSIEKITDRDLGLFRLVKIHLKKKGRFGKKITFISDEAMLNDFFDKNPNVEKIFSRLVNC
ncbi:MAG TPA: hypothetical protein ENJ95_09770 [Bacteroidetes bacterium]|nr:hypothetical protein [Bacteroidota bacterium]